MSKDFYADLLNLTNDAVRKCVSKHVNDPYVKKTSVEDMVQDCIVNFMERDLLSKYDSSRGAFSTYVFKAVYNFLCDESLGAQRDRRKANFIASSLNVPESSNNSNNYKGSEEVEFESTIADTRPSVEDQVMLRSLVSQISSSLNGIHKSVFEYLIQGFNASEISKVLNVGVAKINSSVYFIRQYCRENYSE